MNTSDQDSVVLVVAGSKMLQNSISRLLHDQFSLVFAEEAATAWQQLSDDDHIHLIIGELHLLMNDVALLERVRSSSRRKLKTMPVMALIGESDSDGLFERAIMSGCSDFINLPYSSVELKARVRLHIGLTALASGQENETALAEDTSRIDLVNTLMGESYFTSRLQQELAFSHRHRSYVSISLVQIDQYYEFADQHGPNVQKAIVRTLAKLIESSIRREDGLAYFGDGRFALLFPVTNGLGAYIAVQRLVEKIAKAHIKLQGKEISCSLSVGLYSSIPGEHDDVDQMLDVAGQRLQKAIDAGGDQVVSSKAEQSATLSLEQAINRIKYDKTDNLEQYLPALLEEILPLLKYAEKHNPQAIEQLLDQLDSFSV
jgi:diguanylate cyclase (GGDEF)-like protein